MQDRRRLVIAVTAESTSVTILNNETVQRQGGFGTPGDYRAWLRLAVSTTRDLWDDVPADTGVVVVPSALTPAHGIVSLGWGFESWNGQLPANDLGGQLGPPFVTCEAAAAVLLSELDPNSVWRPLVAVSWDAGITAAICHTDDRIQTVPVGHFNSRRSDWSCACGSNYCVDLSIGGSTLRAKMGDFDDIESHKWQQGIEWLTRSVLVPFVHLYPDYPIVMGGPAVNAMLRGPASGLRMDVSRQVSGCLRQNVSESLLTPLPPVTTSERFEPYVSGGVLWMKRAGM